MSRNVIVIGAGVAGLEAAAQLSMQGINVNLIEKEKLTGGHLNDWFKLFPDRRDSIEVKSFLERLSKSDRVKITGGTQAVKLVSNKGSFTVTTSDGDELLADSVIVATGFDLFKCSKKEEYGYGIYDNVISSADLEKMFRAGKIVTEAGKTPQKVGFVHCVGSRDEKSGNLYCSKLCCVTAVKQAIEIREHLPESKVFCFYMDMRMGGSYYEELYREAQEEWGINFIRGKVSEASELAEGKLLIKVEDTLIGRPMKMELDIMVLMAGMEMSQSAGELVSSAGLETGENRFFKPVDHHYGSNLSNVKGVFLAGTCTGPMNITDSISHARSAVIEVVNYLTTRSN